MELGPVGPIGFRDTAAGSRVASVRFEGDAMTWAGRNDGDEPERRRWHQQVRRSMESGSATSGVALVGFASEEGVRRNGGRPGAVRGPDALRAALAPLALHTDKAIVDAGTIHVEGEDLESAQAELGERVASMLDQHRLVFCLGGGHETAWGSYLGRARSTTLGSARIGVLNLDAHFDLRAADFPTSGTPFLQMAKADAEAGRGFRYTVLGIAEPSNTRALFDTARRLGVRHVLDTQCTPTRLPNVLAEVDRLLAQVNAVHLSIDLDVLPASVAPGVSAPAGYGVAVETIEAVCTHVAASNKLALVDVVELCPRLDVDGRTARTAARLISTLVQHFT